MTDPWLKRPYSPHDENGIVFLWLKSYAHSPFGLARGAHLDGSEGERAYWAEHRPVVMHLLSSDTTEVLCDPEANGVIWAFACTRGDTVHYAVIKRRFKDEATAMFKALLGDRLDRACTYTHDFVGTGLQVPKSWRYNPYSVLP